MKKYEYYNLKDFNVIQTLDCGQIFRYHIDENVANVCSKDKFAILTTYEDKIIIESEDIDYFKHFFDLERDYGIIKTELKKDSMLKPAIEYGYGIRILNNDVYEMIVSFIISANNNIGRIKRSIDWLCKKFGKDYKTHHAFPTLSEMKTAKVEDFVQAGLGYRASQLYETIQYLTDKMIEDLHCLTYDEQRAFLVSLKGIGEKVMNCVMLFGLGIKSVFPVDTWINKVYNNLIGVNVTDRKFITRELTTKYKNLSGYAQQYFFYYYRDNKLK